ncbi:MAG: arginine deiminase family protein [Pseudomonadota bacterium]
MESTFGTSAYGGDGWSPRTLSVAQELGTVWARCGIDSEWGALKAVVVHRPGPELAASADPGAVQMLAPLDVALAASEHDRLAKRFRELGVTVHYADPPDIPNPNQMFCADLMFATPEGVILARPASTVRAGEERVIARRLADIGVPILRSVSGRGTFEGADAMWIDASTVVIGIGLRTNAYGAGQVAESLQGLGVDVLLVDLPFGTMHLMGMFRTVARDLSIAWPRRTPHRLVEALRERDVQVAFLPDAQDTVMNQALNFVTVGERRIVMKSSVPPFASFYASLGVECIELAADELVKAAGGFGCLTGVLERERVG